MGRVFNLCLREKIKFFFSDYKTLSYKRDIVLVKDEDLSSVQDGHLWSGRKEIEYVRTLIN